MRVSRLRKLWLGAKRRERLPGYRRRWAELAGSTYACERELAEVQIAEVYRCAGYAPPAEIVWAGSPWSAADILKQLEQRQQLHHGLTHLDGRIARYRLVEEVVHICQTGREAPGTARGLDGHLRGRHVKDGGSDAPLAEA